MQGEEALSSDELEAVESEKQFQSEIYDRVLRRARKLDRLDVMEHFKDGPRISSIGAVMVAEELDTSVHWIITGERDPWEPMIVRCTDADGRIFNQSI